MQQLKKLQKNIIFVAIWIMCQFGILSVFTISGNMFQGQEPPLFCLKDGINTNWDYGQCYFNNVACNAEFYSATDSSDWKPCAHNSPYVLAAEHCTKNKNHHYIFHHSSSSNDNTQHHDHDHFSFWCNFWNCFNHIFFTLLTFLWCCVLH